MDYIDKLHDLRREKGWSVHELGLRCELSEPSVRKTLYRQSAPLVPSIEKICAVLGVSLTELFCATDELVIKVSDETAAIIFAFESLSAESKSLLLQFIKSLKKD